MNIAMLPQDDQNNLFTCFCFFTHMFISFSEKYLNIFVPALHFSFSHFSVPILLINYFCNLVIINSQIKQKSDFFFWKQEEAFGVLDTKNNNKLKQNRYCLRLQLPHNQ